MDLESNAFITRSSWFNSEKCKIIKYADDTAIVGQCSDNGSEYKSVVNNFIKWSSDNYLDLNVTKIKQMVIDFRREQPVHESLKLCGKDVEIVKEYKYLGTIIDDQLCMHESSSRSYI